MFSEILSLYLKSYFKLYSIFEKKYIHRSFNILRKNKQKLVSSGRKAYRVEMSDLELSTEKLQALKKDVVKSQKVIIGEIDQDGFLLSKVGNIQNAPIISKKQFAKRNRYNLNLVTFEKYVGVEKCYNGNKLAFVNEIKALHLLGMAGCNVPAIMDVDFDKVTLTFSYIIGSVLREELAKQNALVRDRDVNNHPDFLVLNPEERQFKRIQEGKRVLHKVIDSEFIENLGNELKKIHASQFILSDIKYGNIIIEQRSGMPYLIDFEEARYHPFLAKNAFKILVNRNIKEFNLHFKVDRLN